MEAKGETQWSSIIVPSVQEMVKEKTITTVPLWYISDTEIPIIDMKRLCSSTALDYSEVEKLDFACKEWGFFQLVNHGIDSSFLDKIKSKTRDFFNLPMEREEEAVAATT
ncbi:unnamed protein product [Arabis nemorensis]|uniref:Non-haem dioxygenase N-terminal domain-containing protein n=1 Tax=Arabis nemorensis TaxID=586526 RepID=A0A565AQA7_9BRAS|nr:unnamed protein product [Arabis nemorensis]